MAAQTPKGNMPVVVLKDDASQVKGREAQKNNIAAAKIIAEIVHTSLGPKGMDKMLVDSLGDVTITNDGATILKEIDAQHPAAKMMIEISKTIDTEVGDGTTSSVIFAGTLLAKAEELLKKDVHSSVIIEGFQAASEKALEVLAEISKKVTADDRETLLKIASTSMESKLISEDSEPLSKIVVDSIMSITETRENKSSVDLDNLKVEKKAGGSIQDTALIKGIVLDKEVVHSGMPTKIQQAKIALLNTAMEVEKTEMSAEIRINDPTQMQMFLEEENRMIKSMVDKIHSIGANVVICQKGIDELAQHYMAKSGIFAIRRAKKSDMEALSKATSGKIVTNLDDLTPEDLGNAERVEEKKIGESEMTFITGCPEAKSVSVLLRGGTEHVVDEIRRAFDDAVGVVSVAWEDGAVLTGGGSVLAALSRDLRTFAETVGGREQMAIEAFASALEIVPRTLAENAGLDPVTTLIELRKAHADGQSHAGINVYEGGVVDMRKANVIEPLRVVEQAIQSATETAVMILRIDDVISSKGVSMGNEMGDMGDFQM